MSTEDKPKETTTDEINNFFSTISNVIDENDINKVLKKKKTKKEKKEEVRARLREKRRQYRPEEKKKKKKKKKKQLLKILQNLNEEEKIEYFKNKKIIEKEKKEKKKEFLNKSYNEGYKICFNCSFLSLMGEKEVSSLAKQIFLSYHYMIKNEIHIQFHFTNLNNYDTLFLQLQKKYSLNTWKVHVHKQNYWDVFAKEKIVVLSPDATEELTEIKDDEVYIISALVDRSISKNMSFYQASLQNLATKKLPLEKYIKKKKSNVLNVNTVVEILISYLKNNNWLKAFEKCMPQKKVICYLHESLPNEKVDNNEYIINDKNIINEEDVK
ncbi:tRNA m(1)G methyltransferase, putative [Hepatocystis sp. ex Piliocolobus tephrosceles]|nr:tRNA m(1)G methyltransferase, putative [Hepatocystis sp. ex Piliocolobus tephrosceles]